MTKSTPQFAQPKSLASGADLPATPPMPDGLRQIQLSDNARKVLEKRYLRRGPDGRPAESIAEMFWRVAYHVALAEAAYQGDVMKRAVEYYDLLASKKFFPNSPTFTGAGTPLGQLAACFVLPLSDDMGRGEAGIFQTMRNAALIQQTGGGNGFSFSRLRPKNARVLSSSGEATGPIGFLRVYDNAFGVVSQGGARRGANMGVLRVDHPDIEEFITCKTSEHAITNFNISVGITDAFMRAVENDENWDLVFPDVHDPRYRSFDGTLEQAREAGIPLVVHKTVRARDLFDKIVEQAHHNGEPGVLFLDAANRSNPVPHLYQLEATNPCGEQYLAGFENCCLGSVNLSEHVKEDGAVDWEALRKSIILATRFLDNVIDANRYVPGVPQLREAAMRARRIGLGIMGLADLMYRAGIRYGSPEGQEFASQMMEFVRYHAMQTSIDLARDRGPFLGIQGSIYDPEKVIWQPPAALVPHTHDWGRPALDWSSVVRRIKKHGIRNAAQTTVAPTGTIATVAGCEGYGCEPVFALAYIRHVNDNGRDLQLTYASPLFEKTLERAGIEKDAREAIFAEVIAHGTCQDVAAVPAAVRHVFVTSADITAEEHVRMSAAMQAFVDNSISKTANFPAGATVKDVAEAYLLAWKLGAKGITVYVTGSREKVVLETHATARSKEKTESAAVLAQPAEPPMIWHDSKKPRPKTLSGQTRKIETPLGRAFVTINQNGGSQPFEVFITTSKAGSETSGISEAIGRLISYILRLASPVSPADRLREVANQLIGIGGGRSLGFGAKRVRSLPDGIGQVLDQYLVETAPDPDDAVLADMEPLFDLVEEKPSAQPKRQSFDLCPECGEASLANEEGCAKCYGCGFSQC